MQDYIHISPLVCNSLLGTPLQHMRRPCSAGAAMTRVDQARTDRTGRCAGGSRAPGRAPGCLPDHSRAGRCAACRGGPTCAQPRSCARSALPHAAQASAGACGCRDPPSPRRAPQGRAWQQRMARTLARRSLKMSWRPQQHPGQVSTPVGISSHCWAVPSADLGATVPSANLHSFLQSSFFPGQHRRLEFSVLFYPYFALAGSISSP